MASGIVFVEHLTPIPKIKGSNPANDTGSDKMSGGGGAGRGGGMLYSLPLVAVS